jgi:uncharacterized protein YbjT (DUF2867 family)
MKVVIIGGTGLIGSKVVDIIRGGGHQAVAASPDTGVNTLTGAGLAEALAGASVVVDVSNSPSFADEAVMAFFQTSTRNLIAAEGEAGVRHHVLLSIVGTDRLPNSGYLRAKLAQEKLIEASEAPYTILRSTQFYEFVKRITDEATAGDVVRLPPVLVQPIAAAEVAAAVADVALGPPLNGIVEVAGPDRLTFERLVQRGLTARKDPRRVVTDPHAQYFGTELSERSLVAGDGARLGKIHFEDWLSQP